MDKVLFTLLLSLWNRLSQLPIRLTIQLISLNENITTGLCRLEQDKICGDALSLNNLDYMANFDIFRSDGNNATQALLLPLQDSVFRVIQLLVPPESIEVIYTFLDHGHDEYEGQRCDVSEQETDFEEWHKLADSDDQEEHVEEKLELIVQHLEDEAKNVVFLVVQAIRYEMRWCRCAFNTKLAFLFGDG